MTEKLNGWFFTIINRPNKIRRGDMLIVTMVELKSSSIQNIICILQAANVLNVFSKGFGRSKKHFLKLGYEGATYEVQCWSKALQQFNSGYSGQVVSKNGKLL